MGGYNPDQPRGPDGKWEATGSQARVYRRNFPSDIGDYVVHGSAVLEAHGLRKARDLDVLATPRGFAELQKSGDYTRANSRVLRAKNYEGEVARAARVGVRGPKAFKNAEVIQGVPYIPLNYLEAEKRASGKKRWRRGKDRADIKLIRGKK